MHLRDEHLRLGTKKDVKRRAFGIWSDNARQVEEPASGDDNQVPTLPAVQSTQSTPTANTRTNTSRISSTNRSLHAITGNLTALADADDDVSITPSNGSISIKLTNLFKSDNPHWTAFQQRSAVGSLQDELEAYELLDLDAPGEDDLDFDIDPAIENILTT